MLTRSVRFSMVSLPIWRDSDSLARGAGLLSSCRLSLSGSVVPRLAGLGKWQSRGPVLYPDAERREEVEPRQLVQLGYAQHPGERPWGVPHYVGSRLPTIRIVNHLEDGTWDQHPSADTLQVSPLEERASNNVKLAIR
jgi:hypothetical protein